MKKALFYPALLTLILANIFVYACQKENPVSAVLGMQAVTVVDRSAACPQLTISNAIGFAICNIDNGPFGCSGPCPSGPVTNVKMDIIAASPQAFAFVNSDVFSLHNPNAGPINVGINITAGCTAQMFMIPGSGSRTFRVSFNAVTGCCEVVSPC